jgi:predicted transcriptional regulator
VTDLKIAIMSKEAMKEYTLQIARGALRPDAHAPKIFFPSLRAMSEALNENNQALMAAIHKHHPETVSDLATIVQKDLGNVSRALKRLEGYGLVKMEKKVGKPDKTPILVADTISFQMSLSA